MATYRILSYTHIESSYKNSHHICCPKLGRYGDHATNEFVCFYATGVVPEQTSEVAQDGEDVGQVDYHGRVWSVRRHGTTLATSARHHCQVSQERYRRFLRTLAAWYVTHFAFSDFCSLWIMHSINTKTADCAWRLHISLALDNKKLSYRTETALQGGSVLVRQPCNGWFTLCTKFTFKETSPTNHSCTVR